jgi:hypothetical protein
MNVNGKCMFPHSRMLERVTREWEWIQENMWNQLDWQGQHLLRKVLFQLLRR